MKLNTQYAIERTMELLKVDSPTGYTQNVTDMLLDQLRGLGFSPVRTRKGCVVCPLGGQGRPLTLAAHVDTLGLMVRQIKPDGRLAFTALGGPSLQAVETENVTVITRDGKRFTGVVELKNASKHVNRELDSEARNDASLEILLDEEVFNQQAVQDLGVAVGDVVCLNPRARVTSSGFIRSRFLDDKLSAGMLLALAKGVACGEVRLARETALFFSVYEEVGHGASAGIPGQTEDLLVVDMGCVGEGLSCREQQVSICAKDSSGPYDYSMTGELISLAKENAIDYAVDVYPAYGSDAGAALRSGMDIRCALIGAGVYASHGYERSHIRGVENTLRLIEAYVERPVN
ncbi:MAG: M42 family metallopeptidase [Clostridiales bacterium]|nr:M42 family metallopeptidase [Clostridiales bacterium]MDO4350695.1 M42 family metallopeptidase [Eubacteriales bacterium]MDY4008010.1 M42 family metallopeptidase [Candidatus Limiplasma sp.]